MIDPRESSRERALELLADRALFGLAADEQSELDTLLDAVPGSEREALDRVAADVARAYLPSVDESMPADLAARIIADAPRHLPSPPRPNLPSYWSSRSIIGALTVASLLIVLGAWWLSRPGSTPVSSPGERRLELLARLGQPGSDVIRLEWSATADPAAQGASGELVWSNSAQEGYMLFRGLAANAPTNEQYQLWVFDATRDERYPVDGGVFDIPSGGADVIVPIRVKLGVARATLFAVTVERPGGVVVSSRERLPLLAKVPPAAG